VRLVSAVEQKNEDPRNEKIDSRRFMDHSDFSDRLPLPRCALRVDYDPEVLARDLC